MSLTKTKTENNTLKPELKVHEQKYEVSNVTSTYQPVSVHDQMLRNIPDKELKAYKRHILPFFGSLLHRVSMLALSVIFGVLVTLVIGMLFEKISPGWWVLGGVITFLTSLINLLKLNMEEGGDIRKLGEDTGLKGMEFEILSEHKRRFKLSSKIKRLLFGGSK